MSRRPRLLLPVFAAVALFALPTVALAPPSGPAVPQATDGEALATTTAAVQPAAAHRSSRPSPPQGVDSRAVLLLTGTAAGLALVSSLIGRTRRRLTDVGDRWRCLLFGAPPVLASS